MSRRAPSRRNVEYLEQRQSRQLQSMVPGAGAGRFASASPPPPGSYAADYLEADGDPGFTSFARDRFPTGTGTLSGATSSVTLSLTPLDASLHLYLNGLALDEGTDYDLAGNEVTFTGTTPTAGDIVDARYAYDGVPTDMLDEAPSDYPSLVLADEPAVYLRLGEPSGTIAVDSSGGGRDGEYHFPTLGTPGLLVGDSDTCVTFVAASTDFISIDLADNSVWDSTTITCEALIRTSASGAIHSTWDRDDGSSRVFQFRMEASGVLGMIVFTAGGTVNASVTGSTSINDGQPHHIVGTYDGTTIKLFVDGVLDGSVAHSGTLNTGGRLTLGANESGGGHAQAWDGDLDEAAYYLTALSAARIAAHFDATGL